MGVSYKLFRKEELVGDFPPLELTLNLRTRIKFGENSRNVRGEIIGLESLSVETFQEGRRIIGMSATNWYEKHGKLILPE